MSWLPILALAGLCFLAAAFVLRLPRGAYAMFGAALLFGLTGYALQGSPGLPSAPKSVDPVSAETGELIVEARRELFDSAVPPSRFVLTSDAFMRRGQYQDAANLLRNAVAENPRDMEAWLALGNALVEHAEGQLTAAALYAYSRAERIDPSHPGARYFYGLALLRSGQPGQARAIWVQLLGDAPPDAPWKPALAERLGRLDAMLGTAPGGQSGPGPAQPVG